MLQDAIMCAKNMIVDHIITFIEEIGVLTLVVAAHVTDQDNFKRSFFVADLLVRS